MLRCVAEIRVCSQSPIAAGVFARHRVARCRLDPPRAGASATTYRPQWSCSSWLEVSQIGSSRVPAYARCW